MTWKCPECGAQNASAKTECPCGYAYYKVMGIKAGEPEELVSQTYKNLMTLWQDRKFAHDPIALKNARERKKKISTAYDIFRKNFASLPEKTMTKTGRFRTISLSALIILVIAGLIIYLTTSQTGSPVKQPGPQGGTENVTLPPSGNQASVQEKPEGTTASRSESPSRQMHPADQRGGLSEILPDNPEEKAIALVRKSHVIDRIMDVDTLMKRWADENSAKFQVLGWKTKKMDEQIYLVSYSISDGTASKSFYFDVDLSTGAIRHLADHPDLQKKYGIQYKR